MSHSYGSWPHADLLLSANTEACKASQLRRFRRRYVAQRWSFDVGWMRRAAAQIAAYSGGPVV
jgi:hypothetical protein